MSVIREILIASSSDHENSSSGYFYSGDVTIPSRVFHIRHRIKEVYNTKYLNDKKFTYPALLIVTSSVRWPTSKFVNASLVELYATKGGPFKPSNVLHCFVDLSRALRV